MDIEVRDIDRGGGQTSVVCDDDTCAGFKGQCEMESVGGPKWGIIRGGHKQVFGAAVNGPAHVEAKIDTLIEILPDGGVDLVGVCRREAGFTRLSGYGRHDFRNPKVRHHQIDAPQQERFQRVAVLFLQVNLGESAGVKVDRAIAFTCASARSGLHALR